MSQVTLTCTHCGKVFNRAQYEYRAEVKKRGEHTSFFCSQMCYHASLKGQEVIERAFLICGSCGVSFERRVTDQLGLQQRGVKSTFCSRKCHYEHNRAQLPEAVVTEYESGMSLSAIGERYGVSGSSVRGFLDRRGVERRSKTSAWTSEFRRQKNYRRVANGFSFCVSALEDKVAQVLEELGVGFERQKLIRGKRGRYVACVDFWIFGKVALEVNGTFWHCDPRVYPDGPIYKSQEEAFKSYPQKMAALHSLAIPVVEVWEIDILADAFQTVKDAVGKAA